MGLGESHPVLWAENTRSFHDHSGLCEQQVCSSTPLAGGPWPHGKGCEPRMSCPSHEPGQACFVSPFPLYNLRLQVRKGLAGWQPL